jgi:ABC-2 type transport system ATP-binding protein
MSIAVTAPGLDAADPLEHLPPALELNGVSFSYGTRRALQNVSLRLPQGRFTALLGPNGAGKTTLFSLVTRLFTTRQGGIRVLGRSLDREPGEALRLIGVVFQARTLDLDLSAIDNLRYHAALHGMGPREARRRADGLLREAGLTERSRDTVRKLSGGQMRRLEIARALLHRPRLLLLDEPTVGLDVASKWGILMHVRSLARDHGVAILWATHLLDEIDADDRLYVLHKGHVVAHGNTAGVIRHAGAETLRDAFTNLTTEAA